MIGYSLDKSFQVFITPVKEWGPGGHCNLHRTDVHHFTGAGEFPDQASCRFFVLLSVQVSE